MPSTATTVTVTARYLGGGGLTASSDSSRVTVQQQLKADQITVDPTGSAGPWPAGGTVTLANGQAVAIDVRSASGLNVKLAIAGPCALEGNTVKVRGVGGVCTLTASTNGGNGYAAVTQKYYVQTVAGTQTAKVVAPASGTYPRGSRLNLSRRSTVTNVNQPVRWTVDEGEGTLQGRRQRQVLPPAAGQDRHVQGEGDRARHRRPVAALRDDSHLQDQVGAGASQPRAAIRRARSASRWRPCPSSTC